MCSLNESRVFDNAARKLREGLAELGDALSLHLKVTLLCHGSIPATSKLDIYKIGMQLWGNEHIVGRAKDCVDEDITGGSEAIGLGVVRRHIDDGVDI